MTINLPVPDGAGHRSIDSDGIEVVGRFLPAEKSFEKPTLEQFSSLKWLVGILTEGYGLDLRHDVYAHGAIARKEAPEGAHSAAPVFILWGGTMMKNVIVISALMTITCLPSCKSLQRDGNVEVLSITRVIDKNSPGHEMCSSFTLTKKHVAAYFSIADEVAGHEFHHEAMILPCKFKGSIRIDGEYLQWEIFAGGAGYLYANSSVNKRFLCRKNCCNSLPGLC